MTLCVDLLSSAISLIREIKSDSRPVMTAAPSMRMPAQRDHFSCPDMLA